MRVNYGGDRDLDETWLDDGWEPLLRSWLAEAVAAAVYEPNAMVLATVDPAGWPATRTVLCKGMSDQGVVFYTNHGSDKARHLAVTPYASATFAWPLIGRQVTLRGTVSHVDRETTQRYWRSRPRGSQLGAWASDQSRPIGSRADLDRALAEVSARFPGEIPVPDDWGGFLLAPRVVEFWQGRENRLHNRVRLTADADRGWIAERLQP
ncbi:pyridoxamine 5'-phosphate oxidase [Antrihabitans stalactiti]|uniref:Pyridoxine/pyridoxamine 5'-phosphate oxidase n=1 Tax=Antrihabitans stalactiti TaxID=2584121 RepID=A0A848KFN1_9NOCA|nr:pyridoxamine 5'-phosphate oxidase [Antrihabitans stalactiti]NMN96468.1 pyridoxamine 5'-phosphate oxidase [Antrihabitans stalactiti]